MGGSQVTSSSPWSAEAPWVTRRTSGSAPAVSAARSVGYRPPSRGTASTTPFSTTGPNPSRPRRIQLARRMGGVTPVGGRSSRPPTPARSQCPVHALVLPCGHGGLSHTGPHLGCDGDRGHRPPATRRHHSRGPGSRWLHRHRLHDGLAPPTAGGDRRRPRFGGRRPGGGRRFRGDQPPLRGAGGAQPRLCPPPPGSGRCLGEVPLLGGPPPDPGPGGSDRGLLRPHRGAAGAGRPSPGPGGGDRRSPRRHGSHAGIPEPFLRPAPAAVVSPPYTFSKPARDVGASTTRLWMPPPAPQRRPWRPAPPRPSGRTSARRSV